jgi:hypothetical protein
MRRHRLMLYSAIVACSGIATVGFAITDHPIEAVFNSVVCALFAMLAASKS